MFDTDIKKLIVNNVRGFFLTPIISYFGKRGFFEIMLSKKIFQIKDFNSFESNNKLSVIFKYFIRIGLLEIIDNKNKKFKLTSLGSDLAKRYSSYFVPYSYKSYINNIIVE